MMLIIVVLLCLFCILRVWYLAREEYMRDAWYGPGIKIIKKGWGWEEIIWNGDYCGKRLHFHKDKRLSWHWHILKDEVFHLASGKLLLKYGETDNLEDAKEITLNPGDTFHVYPGLRHQMIALEDSDLYEFSSHHYEADSIRIIKGD